MTDTQVTLSFRTEKTIRTRVEEIAEAAGCSTLSEFMRILLLDYISSYSDTYKPADASHTQKRGSSNNICPILRIFATLRCSRCIFQKEKVQKNTNEQTIKEVFSEQII